MKKVLSTLLAATLLLTTVTGLQGLSVSAEGAAGAATSNELIANGNFENDGTVIPLDNFYDTASVKETWGIGRSTVDNLVMWDTVLENNKCTQLYWDNGLGREVSLKSNTTYTFSYKIRSNAKTNNEVVSKSGGLYMAVSEDALLSNRMTWTQIQNLVEGTAKNKEGVAITAQAVKSEWKEYPATWENGELVFTTKTVDPDKKYYLYILTSIGSCIDDCQMVEQQSTSVVSAKTKDGAVISTVQDPDDENNHCLQLNKNDVLTVADFAVQPNTYYKLSYSIKSVAGVDYSATKYHQFYSQIFKTANQAPIEVYNANSEYFQNSGYAYQSVFNNYTYGLDTVTGWQNSNIIFKTEDYTTSKPLYLKMTSFGGSVYADNFSVTKLVSDSEVSADFGFIGTAIKATPESENNQQLRFKAEVNKEALTAGHYNGFTVTEYGFLAFRKDYLATRNDNLNGKLTLNVQAEKDGTTKEAAALKRAAYTAGVDGVSTADIVFSESDTAKQFYARLTGFKVENYNKTYLVRTYAKLKNAAGDELTVYVSDTTGLGVYDLAYAAFTATNSDGSYAESLETRTVLYNLLQGSSYKDSITAPQA